MRAIIRGEDYNGLFTVQAGTGTGTDIGVGNVGQSSPTVTLSLQVEQSSKIMDDSPMMENYNGINTPSSIQNIQHIPHGQVVHESHVIMQSIIVILWYLLFWIVFGLFTLFIFFVEMVEPKVLRNHWHDYYYIWLFVTIISKWILKKIARRIDRSQIVLCHALNAFQIMQIIQMNGNSDNNGSMLASHTYVSHIKHHFSLEWVTELLMSMLYWQVYRQNITYFLVQLNWGFFAFTVISHFASEFCVSTIHLSKQYFDLSTSIISNFKELRFLKCTDH